MSREKLAATVGPTFQQIQKYERGTNRVGSSRRLFQFGQILGVPVSFFFDDRPEEIVRGQPRAALKSSKRFQQDQFARREALELVRAYYKIRNPVVRKRVFELTKAIAGVSPGTGGMPKED
ncbi:MAG: helix-turn-helix transcriptional regulator [Alphaproteobacteria bacterium]|nr:helix-turn-helix transcriptional regulator [Alphaproteobacteria bacterium]